MEKPTDPKTRFDLHTLEELRRSVSTCHPNWERIGKITLEFAATEPEREAWLGSTWLPLAEAIRTGIAAAAQGDLKAVSEADRRLEGCLPPDVAERSRLAGNALLADNRAPAGERFLNRLQVAVREGKTPGHLGLALASRGVVFHLAPVFIAGSYLLLETQGVGRLPAVCALELINGGLRRYLAANEFKLRAA